MDTKTLRQLRAFRRGRRGRHGRTYEEEARQESIILGTHKEAVAEAEEQDSAIIHQTILDELLRGATVEEVLSRAEPDQLAVVKMAITNWRRLRRSHGGGH